MYFYNVPYNNNSDSNKTEVPLPSDDMVSVRFAFVWVGYLACAVTAMFSVGLVFMSPGPESNGSLRYISEGMENHCGWSIVVLGTTGTAILICHIVAAAHMANHFAVFWALIEAMGWNIVLGVVDTGWTFHYMGLAFFLIGNIAYHWIACRDVAYGSLMYKQSNIISILFAFTFICAAIGSKLAGEGDRQARALAVSLEFAMSAALTLQNMFLVKALDKFKNIHIVFQPR
jgi:hypothetical protein